MKEDGQDTAIIARTIRKTCDIDKGFDSLVVVLRQAGISIEDVARLAWMRRERDNELIVALIRAGDDPSEIVSVLVGVSWRRSVEAPDLVRGLSQADVELGVLIKAGLGAFDTHEVVQAVSNAGFPPNEVVDAIATSKLLSPEDVARAVFKAYEIDLEDLTAFLIEAGVLEDEAKEAVDKVKEGLKESKDLDGQGLYKDTTGEYIRAGSFIGVRGFATPPVGEYLGREMGGAGGGLGLYSRLAVGFSDWNYGISAGFLGSAVPLADGGLALMGSFDVFADSNHKIGRLDWLAFYSHYGVWIPIVNLSKPTEESESGEEVVEGTGVGYAINVAIGLKAELGRVLFANANGSIFPGIVVVGDDTKFVLHWGAEFELGMRFNKVLVAGFFETRRLAYKVEGGTDLRFANAGATFYFPF